jgi:hypothetical protein
VRREDAVARYGGEEFAILLPNTSLDQALHVAENIHAAISRVTVIFEGHPITITVSGGLAMIASGERAESMIGRADTALYSAKTAGRNRTFIHDGVESLSAADFPGRARRMTGPAASLIGMIHSCDSSDAGAGEEVDPQAYEFGSYLVRDAISAGLAQTCEELRRIVQQRGERQREAAPTES